MSENKFDTLIIGSGISGLTAGILLAQEGQKVLILEQHHTPGGYMHTFERFHATFDTGAHYVGAMGPGQPFRVLLEMLGCYDSNLFVPMDPEGFDAFRFPDEEYLFCHTHQRTVEALSQKFPNERKAIQEFFNLIKSTSEIFPTYQFDTQFNADKIQYFMNTPLSYFVEPLTTNRRLKSVFYAYCTLHGTKPKDVPFGAHAIITDSLLTGAYGFNGGGGHLTKMMVERFQSLGGKLQLSEEVIALKGKQGIEEVITNKEHSYQANWVISSLHPKNTIQLLKDFSESASVSRWSKRINEMEESLGVFALYSRLESALNDFRPYRNYYFLQDEFDGSFFDSPSPLDPKLLFLSRPGKNLEKEYTDRFPTLNLHCPTGFSFFEQWQETKYSKRPEEYKAFKQASNEKILAMAEKFHPELKGKVKASVTSSPLTNLHFNQGYQGSCYGIYHGIENTGMRAIQARTKVPNLLLTGQSTSFPGLQSSATSGMRTAGQIVGIKKFLDELKERMS